MEKFSTSPFSLLSIVCATFGHDYNVSRKVTDHINEYTCTHCGKEITDNTKGTIEILTEPLKRANNSLASFYSKRHSKISA
jgi:transposase-like protein